LYLSHIKNLGAGHEESVYRDAMSLELQEKGYIVKTEMPISIKYKTTKNKEIIIGSAKIDIYLEKGDEKALLELKAVAPLIKKDREEKNNSDMKEYAQLRKYLATLNEKTGFIVNFLFPPKKDGPEVIESEQ